ncbi:SREBP regulating gene protein-like [Sciurus carolinensis]|uniref:SREBP regulating gene protein-like n=1 Tax=Sciurus carolinensis TaxID=30640 RepID=UPI001FB20D16|nr:SREBP regulating gene protein-like [Sciurus carolinensis]XP_047393981.1 SREBP regulating gene protein-like [Sciurus carolinensis]
MVNLAAMVWRCLLEKRSMLVLVFRLWQVYILSNTLKQEDSTSAQHENPYQDPIAKFC